MIRSAFLKVAGGLLAALLLLGGISLWVRPHPVFVDSSYWLMATSLFREGDLFLLDQEPKMAVTEFHLTTTGHLAKPHFAGSALIAIPFLAWGQVLLPIFNPPDSNNWNTSVFYGPPGRYRLLWYNASVVSCGLFFS